MSEEDAEPENGRRDYDNEEIRLEKLGGILHGIDEFIRHDGLVC